jgi:hypothetical protein
MKKKIELPNNNFGALLILAFAVLAFLVPFVIALWLIALIAPWWVSVPVALLVGLLIFAVIVKFPNK